MDSTSMSGTENNVFFLAEPVPGVMFTVTNPTGSVVAVSALTLTSEAAANATAAQRGKRCDFIMKSS